MRYLKRSLSTLFVVLFMWEGYQSQLVEIHVPLQRHEAFTIRLPRKEKKQLELGLYRMLILDAGAYALFGAKPMFMHCFWTSPSLKRSWRYFLNSIQPQNRQCYSAWKTCRKYLASLKDTPFLFVEEKNPFIQEPHEILSVVIINRNKFSEVFLSNKRDFESVLNREGLTSEFLLNEATQKPLLGRVLQKHEGLIGTLFGYGRENAWLFERKMRGEPIDLVPLWDQEVFDFFAHRPDTMNLKDLALVLGYPTFLANKDSSESRQLRQEFLNTRSRIIDYYKGKDFLPATLALLIEGPS